MSYRWTALVFLVSSACTFAGQASDSLSPKQLTDLKGATAMIVVGRGEQRTTGSGFLIHSAGAIGQVVTNHHVIAAARQKEGVAVVFHSGTRQEKSVPAEVLFSDPDADLALLQVRMPQLPEAISIEKVQLVETSHVYVLGFPFGEALSTSTRNPSVTVSQASISSVRRDDNDRVVLVQLDGNLNPGNSGGPVVDGRGRLVGVAVAKIDSAGIGFAIPAEVMRTSFTSRIIEVELVSIGRGRMRAVCRLMDLFGTTQKAYACVADAIDVAMPQPTAEGGYEKLSTGKVFPVNQSKDRLSADLTVNSLQGKARYVVQFRLDRTDGAKVYTQAVPVDMVNGLIEGGRRVVSLQNEQPSSKVVVKGPSARMAPGAPATGGLRKLSIEADVSIMVPAPNRAGVFYIRPEQDGNKLVYHDLEADKASDPLSVPKSPAMLGVVGDLVAVVCPSSSVVVLVDPATQKVTNAVELPPAVVPTRLCRASRSDRLFLLCKEGHCSDLYEIDLESRKSSKLAQTRAEYAVFSSTHAFMQTNFGGSPSGLASIYPIEVLQAEQQVQEKRLAHESFCEAWSTPDGLFVAGNDERLTKGYNSSGQPQWVVQGQMLASWPDGSGFLLTTGDHLTQWTALPLLAVDARGETLWEQALPLGDAIVSGLITGQAVLYGCPERFRLGTAQFGNALITALQSSPLAITRPMVVASKDRSYLVFSFSVYDGLPSGRFCIDLVETGRGWFMTALPGERAATGKKSGAPSRLKAGDVLDYQPDLPKNKGPFRLKSGPDGMSVDARTGHIRWNTGIESLGYYDVVVVVDDGGVEKVVFEFKVRVTM